MVAMTGPRQIKTRKGEIFNRPVAAAVLIYSGALVCLNAGYAVKGSAATGLIADGFARETVDNRDGAAGAQRIDVETGYGYLKNSAAADAITLSDVGSDCYIVDDQTVAKTSGGGTRSIAGKIKDVDSTTGEVLVRVGL